MILSILLGLLAANFTVDKITSTAFIVSAEISFLEENVSICCRNFTDLKAGQNENQEQVF